MNQASKMSLLRAILLHVRRLKYAKLYEGLAHHGTAVQITCVNQVIRVYKAEMKHIFFELNLFIKCWIHPIILSLFDTRLNRATSVEVAVFCDCLPSPNRPIAN